MAAEIKLRAERRAGELLAGLDKATGGQPYQSTGTDGVPVENTPTLSDMGITKNQSSQWQRVAAIDENAIENAINDGKKNHRPATSAQIVAKVNASGFVCNLVQICTLIEQRH